VEIDIIWFKAKMKKSELRILLVEDDAFTAQTNKRLLRPFGAVIVARDVSEAHELLANQEFNIAFFDLNLYGELDGLKLLNLAKHLNIYSIVLSGEVRKEVLEEAFLNGAKDYLNKPFSEEKLSSVLKRFFIHQNHIEFENLINKSFITKSQSLTEELYKIKNLAFSDKPVFISGETGTGKRVVAHLIKNILGNENFIEINCSQYTDDLFASEVFGHVSGAFTGARNNKIGLLEQANNGIIFLDEIHALSPKAQKTLLKAIEEKEFYPVGGEKKIRSNFRVISATCENISDLINQGAFRQDLYARISTFEIELSPLRNRVEDVKLLLEYFISQQPFRIIINDQAIEVLSNYSWPRNTREIQDLVENWVVHGNRLITPDVLPAHIRTNIDPKTDIISDYYLDLIEEVGLKEFLIMFKKELIHAMIKRHKGVVKHASQAMGASYGNLTSFLKSNSDKSLNQRRAK
jgi:DNA-binding NtrC family response regulator